MPEVHCCGKTMGLLLKGEMVAEALEFSYLDDKGPTTTTMYQNPKWPRKTC